jgi:hypothetical protein
MPFGSIGGGPPVYLQYGGYAGSLIKQADTVLLIYPLEWNDANMTRQSAADTLAFYAERTDPDGPAMTDAIHAVDSTQIGEPGCATHTYLMRSILPFVRDPFAQFAEARGDKAGSQDPLAGSPTYNFLTGSSGFTQVFTFGLTALRWRGTRCTSTRCCRRALGRRHAQGPALAGGGRSTSRSPRQARQSTRVPAAASPSRTATMACTRSARAASCRC